MQGRIFFLTGFMGSGKSYWGHRWAQQTGLPFYDLDSVIEEQQQRTIAKIFEAEGETYFRGLETAALQRFAGHSGCIIACGGGTPCFNGNMEWMNAHGITVYLKATPEEIIHRVEGEQEKRPLIKNLSLQELTSFIEKKLQEREPFYARAKYIFPVAVLNEKTIQALT